MYSGAEKGKCGGTTIGVKVEDCPGYETRTLGALPPRPKCATCYLFETCDDGEAAEGETTCYCCSRRPLPFSGLAPSCHLHQGAEWFRKVRRERDRHYEYLTEQGALEEVTE